MSRRTEHDVYIWLVLRERSYAGCRSDTAGDLVLEKTSTKNEAPSVPPGCVLTRIRVVVPHDVLHPPVPEAQEVRVERNAAAVSPEVTRL